MNSISKKQHYVIGIAGTISGASVALANIDGKVINSVETNEGIHCRLLNWAEIFTRLKGILTLLSHKSSVDLDDIASNCESVCISASGVDYTHQREQLKFILTDVGIKNAKRYIITGIANAVLVGGTTKEYGVVLHSGVGSVCSGRNEHGKLYRVGGWGEQLDNGGSFGMAVKVLKAIYHAYDGIGPPCPMLTDLILRKLEIGNIASLGLWLDTLRIASSQFTYIAEIAEIASAALYAAVDSHDSCAKEIIDDSISALCGMANRVCSELGISNNGYEIVMSGSNFRNLYFSNEAKKRLQGLSIPNAHITEGKFAPVFGALVSALGEINEMPKEKVFANFSEYMENISVSEVKSSVNR